MKKRTIFPSDVEFVSLGFAAGKPIDVGYTKRSATWSNPEFVLRVDGKLHDMGRKETADENVTFRTVYGEGRAPREGGEVRKNALTLKRDAIRKLDAGKVATAAIDTAKTPEPVPAPEPVPSPVATTTEPLPVAKKSGDTLTDMIVDIVSDYASGAIVESILPRIETLVSEAIANKVPRRTKVEFADHEHTFNRVTHRKLTRVMKYLTKKKAVWLVGEAGTGKNVLVEDIAEAWGKAYFYMNALTDEFSLKGFMNAMGKYTAITEFLEFCENGGICFIDEIDQSIPEILKQINAAIANGYFAFPHKGRVTLHEDCRFVVAANTRGNGGDEKYSGYKLDGSSTNRFVMVDIDYDPEIELVCADGDKELVEFTQEWRRACESAGVSHIASYRQITGIVDMLDCDIPLPELMQEVWHPTLGLDDVRVVKSTMKGMESNRYHAALAAA